MTAIVAPRRLTIATRESALAIWQAEHVRSHLTSRYPGTSVELLGITTQGDRVLDRPLAAIGGKGLFIKELENALGDGRADIAVAGSRQFTEYGCGRRYSLGESQICAFQKSRQEVLRRWPGDT